MKGCPHPSPWLTIDPFDESRAICGQCGKPVKLATRRRTEQLLKELKAFNELYGISRTIRDLDDLDDEELLEWP